VDNCKLQKFVGKGEATSVGTCADLRYTTQAAHRAGDVCHTCNFIA